MAVEVEKKQKVRRKLDERRKLAILDELEWSQPLTLKAWCLVYGIDYGKSRGRLIRWFNNPEKIRTKRLDSRTWCVDISDLPAEYILHVIFAETLEDIHRELTEDTHLRLGNANGT